MIVKSHSAEKPEIHTKLKTPNHKRISPHFKKKATIERSNHNSWTLEILVSLFVNKTKQKTIERLNVSLNMLKKK